MTNKTITNCNDNEISVVIKMKELCDTISRDEQTAEYSNISKIINTYIEKNCKHEIIHDMIDINPDESVQIYYCCKCNLTIK